MRKFYRIFTAVALGALALSACSKNNSQGESASSAILLRNQTIQSAYMKEGMKYTIWLPGGAQPTESYPFLYLLHGAGDDQNAWTDNGTAYDGSPQGGNAVSIIREYLAAGGIDMVVVMPDAKLTFYTGEYEDYFHKELIPQLESKYKCNGKRAVAGLSMGGFGTLYHALKYPEKFTYAYAMSPAVFGDMAEGVSEGKKYPDFTIEIGSGDQVVNNTDAKRLAQDLKEAGISCELVERVGGHTWTFWRECLPKALQKIGNSFK